MDLGNTRKRLSPRLESPWVERGGLILRRRSGMGRGDGQSPDPLAAALTERCRFATRSPLPLWNSGRASAPVPLSIASQRRLIAPVLPGW